MAMTKETREHAIQLMQEVRDRLDVLARAIDMVEAPAGAATALKVAFASVDAFDEAMRDPATKVRGSVEWGFR